MPKSKKLLAQRLAKRIARKVAQDAAQEVEQEKVKNFHLEEFLKTHKRIKMGKHTWKSLQQSNGKEPE